VVVHETSSRSDLQIQRGVAGTIESEQPEKCRSEICQSQGAKTSRKSSPPGRTNRSAQTKNGYPTRNSRFRNRSKLPTGLLKLLPSGNVCCRKKSDGNATSQFRVRGLKHLAHSACSQMAGDFVMCEFGSDHDVKNRPGAIRRSLRKSLRDFEDESLEKAEWLDNSQTEN